MIRRIEDLFMYTQESGAGSAGGTLTQFEKRRLEEEAAKKKAAEEAAKQAELGSLYDQALVETDATNAAAIAESGARITEAETVTPAQGRDFYANAQGAAFADGAGVTETETVGQDPDAVHAAGLAGEFDKDVVPIVDKAIVDNEDPEEDPEEDPAFDDYTAYLKELGLGDPSIKAGQTAFERMLADNKLRQQASSQGYGDLYQQAKESSTRRKGLSDTTGFSGGQAEQFSDKLSAAEIGALGGIGRGRLNAADAIEAEKGSFYSDALLEAQQTQEYQDYREDRGFDIASKITQIQNDPTLTDAQKESLIASFEGADADATAGNFDPGDLGFVGTSAEADFLTNEWSYKAKPGVLGGATSIELPDGSTKDFDNVESLVDYFQTEVNKLTGDDSIEIINKDFTNQIKFKVTNLQGGVGEYFTIEAAMEALGK